MSVPCSPNIGSSSPSGKSGSEFRQINALDWDANPLPVVPTGAVSWGVVATVKADTRAIARFIAWHLDIGAKSVAIYLDAPDEKQIEALRHPNVKLVACDDAHWGKRRFRPDQHQLRQVRNATEEWRKTQHEWLAHIDVDEFLMPPHPMAEILSNIPISCAVLQVPPVEQLAGAKGELFKRTATYAGLKKNALREVYPTFGHYLRGGFLSHLEGKVLLRASGRPRAAKVRLGIHMAYWQGEKISNRITLPDLPLGHAHAPDWETFKKHLAFRREKGSYRNKIGEKFLLAELLDFLDQENGEDGFKLLFDEAALATPDLIDRLGKRNMLLKYPLDLDGALRRWYPGFSS